jgi:hypothetical protein
VQGASDDGAWTLVGSLSWNRGLVDYAGEGDLTLSRGDDEVFATLTRSAVTDAEEGEDADHLIKLQYEIDGGAGAFADATGAGEAEGSLAGDRFAGTWVLSLDSGG